MSILVVEDDDDIRSILARGLADIDPDVECVATGRDAVRSMARRLPTAVVLDVMLPDMSGIEVCKTLRRSEYQGPIVFLSGRTGVSDRAAGLDAGADDYIVKPFALAELIARVRVRMTISGRAPNVDKAQVRFHELSLDIDSQTVASPTASVGLTLRETELLACLFRSGDRLVSRQTLYDRVWQDGETASHNVVDVYIGYLRNKLAALGHGNQSLIVTVRGRGFRLRPPHAA